MQIFHLSALAERLGRTQPEYHEFLRVATLSAGVYVIPAGATDDQSPHTEDEVYYVVRGAARVRVGDDDEAVEAGTFVFVPKDVPHHFHSIQDDLHLLVLFAPPFQSTEG